MLATFLAALILTPAACRDDVEPFQPEDRPAASDSILRLTYSQHDDHMPSWSLTGDTVYYSAEGFETQPSSLGVLVSVPAHTGPGQPLLSNVQGAGSLTDHWLLAPSRNPVADRLAFIEVVDTFAPAPCAGSLRCSVSADKAGRTLLWRVAVWIRDSNATGPLNGGASLIFEPLGSEFDGTTGNLWIIKNYPFQRLIKEERRLAIRASWAPDGERLVFSDGLRLLIWPVDEDSAQVIPNTADGAWPAWSPDGEWIAFTQLVRIDSTSATCTYHGEFGELVCTEVRTDYTDVRHELALIRPDGSGLRELGEGEAPAWSPDANHLYFRRANMIWRIAPPDSSAVAIPGTDGGYEPAVSPTGRHLAFSKRSGLGDLDIWIVLLQP
jgi:Tol biopolymer transport system component